MSVHEEAIVFVLQHCLVACGFHRQPLTGTPAWQWCAAPCCAESIVCCTELLVNHHP